MKVAVSGRDAREVQRLMRMIAAVGFALSKKPDVVISFGGDGSLLFAEREFPGVPKLPLRDRSICEKCNEGELQDLLGKLAKKRYEVEHHHKLEARVKAGGKVTKRLAVNDVVVRNVYPYEALRFAIEQDARPVGEFIGDGAIVASAFGSTGYFYSISKKSFREGIGLAFNNVTVKAGPIVCADSAFRIHILRNAAHLCTDNDPKLLKLSQGAYVDVRKSRNEFRLVRV